MDYVCVCVSPKWVMEPTYETHSSHSVQHKCRCTQTQMQICKTCLQNKYYITRGCVLPDQKHRDTQSQHFNGELITSLLKTSQFFFQVTNLLLFAQIISNMYISNIERCVELRCVERDRHTLGQDYMSEGARTFLIYPSQRNSNE